LKRELWDIARHRIAADIDSVLREKGKATTKNIGHPKCGQSDRTEGFGNLQNVQLDALRLSPRPIILAGPQSSPRYAGDFGLAQKASRAAVYAKPALAFSTVATTNSDNVVQIWRVFKSTAELVDQAKVDVPRCLTSDEREKASLEREPPAWCVEQHKWPYRDESWTRWLADRGEQTWRPEHYEISVILENYPARKS